MSETPILSAWSSFYVMTGSSAAALVGLMFVVISLVQVREIHTTQDGITTFSTPTVMHFGAVLLISAVLTAPWHRPFYAALSVGVIGFLGVGYLVRVAYRTKQFTEYRADLDDWIWYTILPLLAYSTILIGAIVLLTLTAKALFAIGGGVVLLLVIGIRNAWDIVTFLAAGGPSQHNG
ncbi:MAG TPA: hypothetical protein VKR05_06630 [Candidatus Cybelea sp.]|nr:hypothetical protein [Candidatus Cybelea sp.]